MTANELFLTDFRNYREEKFQFSDNINVLFGNNGQGKTNVVEAVFLCAIGSSFRSSHTTELINHDAESFTVEMSLKGDITNKIKYTCDRKNKKAIKVDGIYLQKIGELMGSVLAVLFSPEDLQLVTEGPSLRRRFTDIALSQQKPSYFYSLSQYNKILAQKNSLLRDMRVLSYGGKGENDKKLQSMKEQTEIWNMQLAKLGASVIVNRLSFLRKLSEEAEKYHSEFSANRELLEISYDSFFESQNGSESEEEINEMFIRTLSKNLNREIERETCLYGPHRDDLLFKINDSDLKKFGSQGQKRTAVLAVKLAELEIMKKDTGRTPILLLDDVLSELDPSRQKILLSASKKVQTFITCTDRKKVHVQDCECAFFNIKNGSLFAKSV